jgi:DNA-binding transcriptional regulator/RsmH inhibitor MraZ
MAVPAIISKELLNRIKAVSNKRARFVLDSIVKNGMVTTEEINHAGYEHPPRAVRDARELGFAIQTIKVKHTNGRSIAAYVFQESAGIDLKKSGRIAIPKKQRDEIIAAAGRRCQICGASTNLQVDHRIPYEVAGESQAKQANPYLVLCGSCNRKKSWSCEHCPNWLRDKNFGVCSTCYWAEPQKYDHIGTERERRADIVWMGDEVQNYERIRLESKRKLRTVPEHIKEILRTS